MLKNESRMARRKLRYLGVLTSVFILGYAVGGLTRVLESVKLVLVD